MECKEKGKKMKIFRKERLADGRRHIFFCGMKIASYMHRHKKHFAAHKLSYKSYGDLIFDIKRNIVKIPSDIDLIVGVPRSGMVPAYMIGLALSKQVCSLPEFIAGMWGEHGQTRKIHTTTKIKKVLIIDDTVSSGKSMTRVKERIAEIGLDKKYDCLYMAVYGANNDAFDYADIILEILPQPRMFAWNYLNHVYLENAGLNIDGVLCVDPTPEENDDGKNYVNFVLNARPLYLPKEKVAALITSRLEKYRPQTEQWLREHNVQYDKLYMLENMTAEERRRKGVHAKHKANILKQHPEVSFFIESDPKQAQEIAKITGRPVFCSTNDEKY